MSDSTNDLTPESTSPEHSADEGVSFPRLEAETLQFWQKNQVFQKSLQQTQLGPQNTKHFSFYDGPPFATGLPHYGHMLAGTIKDIIPRYWTMQGYHVPRRFGWDCHGLPIEFEIDKVHKFSGRKSILAFGVDKYNALCRSIVQRYTQEWQNTVQRMGRWVDMDNPYRTMDLDFMHSVWWVFGQLWQKGLLYEGYKVVPYSIGLTTVLSNFEAGQNYKDVQDPALTVLFQDSKEPDLFYCAWTTTPWTLPSNMGLVLHPQFKYLIVKDLQSQKRIVIAESRIESIFKNTQDYEVLQTLTGSELENRHYVPLFPYFSAHQAQGAFRTVCAEFVTADAGTGIVHAAPAFGEDDFNVAKLKGLPLVCPIDDDGCFTAEVPEFQGQMVKDADKAIIAQLKKQGNLFRHDTITHAYPFCERSDTPLIYKAVSSWYVKVEAIKEQIQKLNKETTHWVPEHLRDGRFGKWLEGARDWAITRNRFWGTPLPLWKNERTGKVFCFYQLSELEKVSGGQKITDLHLDSLAKLEIKDPETGEVLVHSGGVLDCWFESGAMPYAQLNYPYSHEKDFDKFFPADFIAEGLDQTRGWFYTLSILGTALFGKIPFKNVIVNGIVLAEDGKKMSKRWKNYPDPNLLLDTYGADAIRLYMIDSGAVKAEDLRFSERGVKDVVRRIQLRLWNAFHFWRSYAEIDAYYPPAASGSQGILTQYLELFQQAQIAQNSTPTEWQLMDSWIVSRLHSLIAHTRNEMDVYRLYNVVPKVLQFVDDLTNTYIRFSRTRFWGEGKGEHMDPSKKAAFDTLYYVLLEFSKVLAPFAPFISEALFRRLTEADLVLTRGRSDRPLAVDDALNSVHLQTFPQVNQRLIRLDLEEALVRVESILLMGRNFREKIKQKIKIPLKTLKIIHRDATMLRHIKKFESLLLRELNVLEVQYVPNEEEYVELLAKPNFALLGSRLGKRMKEFAAAFGKLSLSEKLKLEMGQSISLLDETFTAQEIVVSRQGKKNYPNVLSDALVAIELDPTVDESQIQKGLAREIVNRIQKLRKTSDLRLDERIHLALGGSSDLQKAFEANQSYIESETLCLKSAWLASNSETFKTDWHLRIKEKYEINEESLNLELYTQ